MRTRHTRTLSVLLIFFTFLFVVQITYLKREERFKKKTNAYWLFLYTRCAPLRIPDCMVFEVMGT
jgi:hypothetical protein